MDPQDLLREAVRALGNGADRSDVNARIREASNGEYENLESLAVSLGVDTARDATEWVPPADDADAPPTPEENEALQRLAARPGNALTDFLRMGAQGLTLGFADELAGAGAAIGGEDYAEARDASRQRIEDLRLLNPGASLASEIAGAAVVPGGAGRAIGNRIAARTGNRLVGGIGGGAIAGGAGGAAFGVGEAEGGIGERALGAIVPGAVSSLLGGLTGGGAVAGGRALEAARGIAGGGGGSQPTGGAGLAARANLLRALREADVPPEQIPQRLSDIGPDAVVADLGVNLAREARAAANQAPGLARPGGPIEQLAARAQGRGERIASDLTEAAGFQRTFAESLEAAEEARRAVRTEYYKPLEALHPEVDAPGIKAALQRPDVQELAGNVIPDEVLQGQRNPTFRELQDILGELADERSAARVAGRPNRMQKANNAWEAFEGTMRRDIPGFEEAQQAWHVASRRIDAHEMGRKAAYKAPDDILRELQSLPEEARDAYRRGIVDRFEMQLRERTTGGGRATALISAGQTMRDRLRIIAENDPAFERLLRDLQREGIYSRTWNQIAGNSTTAQQLTDEVGQFVQDMAVSKAWVIRRLLSTLIGLTPGERRQASLLLGEALMNQGEEAAELLAREINMLGSIAGTAGGVAGGAAAPGVAR